MLFFDEGTKDKPPTDKYLFPYLPSPAQLQGILLLLEINKYTSITMFHMN
jgi:hypothetical protein